MPVFNTSFPTSLHGWEIVNVKAFGAVGDGTTYDTAALQATFDYAWGPRTSPHGGGPLKHTNRAVYLPPGDYKTIGPLYITGVAGGKLFGDGAESTMISLVNPMAGNLWVTSGSGSELAPCIAMNGCAQFTMENFSIRQLSPLGAPLDFGSVGIWFINYGHGTSVTATVPIFRNMTIRGFQHGLMVGYGDPGGANAENGTLYSIEFFDCTSTCLMAFHYNVLNWNVFGGGAQNCATTAGSSNAAYSAIAGAISVISGVKMVDNGLDFYTGTFPIAVLGGYSTSQKCASASAMMFLSGFSHSPLNSAGSIFLNSSGQITVSGCEFAPINDTGAGKIGETNTVGTLIVDALKLGTGATSSSFSGSGVGSSLFVRAVRPQTGQNLFANYTGRVVEYTPEGATALAYMPAHAKFRGLTRIINDSTITTVGADVVGGGSSLVYAYCTGSAWKIIGPAV